MTKSYLLLLLSINILVVNIINAFNTQRHNPKAHQWIVQRTYHQDRITSIPVGLGCSDVRKAAHVSGQCVCPKDHVFHFDENERAVCIGEEAICKGMKDLILFCSRYIRMNGSIL